MILIYYQQYYLIILLMTELSFPDGCKFPRSECVSPLFGIHVLHRTRVFRDNFNFWSASTKYVLDICFYRNATKV